VIASSGQFTEVAAFQNVAGSEAGQFIKNGNPQPALSYAGYPTSTNPSSGTT
jgi:hypothetical protein